MALAASRLPRLIILAVGAPCHRHHPLHQRPRGPWRRREKIKRIIRLLPISHDRAGAVDRAVLRPQNIDRVLFRMSLHMGATPRDQALIAIAVDGGNLLVSRGFVGCDAETFEGDPW